MGDHAPADPTFHTNFAMIATTIEAMTPLETADAPLNACPVAATFVIQADLRHCVIMEKDGSGPDSIRPGVFFTLSAPTDIDLRLRDWPTAVYLALMLVFLG
jgi:hypothetical protein